MKHRNQRTTVRWPDSAGMAEVEMIRKHEAQIAEHEKVYGKLGELQTKRQKETLKRHLKQQAKR